MINPKSPNLLISLTIGELHELMQTTEIDVNLASGPGGPGFKSLHPDHWYQRVMRIVERSFISILMTVLMIVSGLCQLVGSNPAIPIIFGKRQLCGGIKMSLMKRVK